MSPHNDEKVPDQDQDQNQDQQQDRDDDDGAPWRSLPVGEHNVHFKVYGSGSEVILLLPGAIGTIESDFSAQLSPSGGLSREEFTLVAVDLPGYGRSRPPEKRYSERVYEVDAEAALAVMTSLGHRTFSILGWSDGGKVALLMAIRQRARVNKIALWGTLSYATPDDVVRVVKTRDLTKWEAATKARYEAVYGRDMYTHMWAVYMSYCERVCVDYKWDLREELPTIRSSALVLHGDRDPIATLEHPTTLCKLIPDSRMHRFPDGTHNIHQTHTEAFNELVTQFFLE